MLKLYGLGDLTSASAAAWRAPTFPKDSPNLTTEGKEESEAAPTGEQNHQRRDGVDGANTAI